MIEKVEIGTVQDLLSELDRDDEAVSWFRGQRNSEWELKPYFFRLESPPSETTLLTRFRQNASRLIENSPGNDFDWLFLMQHYGVPTRLLDWSENPLVALYFAVFGGSHDNADGALWQLDPISLNAAAGIDPETEEGFIPSFDDDELNAYSMASLKATPRTKLKPIATIATRNSPRIQAQAGVFTVHHLVTDALDDIHPETIKRIYIVPSDAKPVIASQLKRLGFTRFHLFPELESIGASVRDGII